MFIHNQDKQHIRVLVCNHKTKKSEPQCGINYIKVLFPKSKDAVTSKTKNTLKRLWSEQVRVLIPGEGKENLPVTD